jgi:hypothetical protein
MHIVGDYVLGGDDGLWVEGIFHRVYRFFETRLPNIALVFNMQLPLNRSLNPKTDPQDRLLYIAQYAL